MKKKIKELKQGDVIIFIKSDKYIKTCFKPFEKTIWNDNEIVHSMKFRLDEERGFAIDENLVFSVHVPKYEFGKLFIIANRAKKIRGKKRKSKKWAEQ